MYDVDWDKEPLGKCPDEALAKKIGCSVATVRAKRLQRGIFFKRGRGPRRRDPTKQIDIDWDAQPLGKVKDEDLAKTLRVPRVQVMLARQTRKIPILGSLKFGTGRTRIDWDKEPLGEIPDKDLADKHGVSRQRIEQVRRARGIPSVQSVRIKEYERRLEESGLLGKLPDSAVAELTDVSQAVVSRFRKAKGIEPRGIESPTDWDTVGLGERPDVDISQELGVAYGTVMRNRQNRGIPPFPEARVGPKFIDWDKAPLGKKPDGEIARDFGVAPPSVINARRSRGIKRFQPPGRQRKRKGK